jgi:hypothetical protein
MRHHLKVAAEASLSWASVIQVADNKELTSFLGLGEWTAGAIGACIARAMADKHLLELTTRS